MGNFKYFNAIYYNCKKLPRNMVYWLILICFYIVTINLSAINYAPIFYPLPLIFLYLYKKDIFSFLVLNIFIFLAGIIDDIVFCRILGTSSIFYLLLFNISLFFLNSTRKPIYYVGHISLIVLYYSYQIISLIFLRNSFYMEILHKKEIFYYELIALASTFIILVISWLANARK